MADKISPIQKRNNLNEVFRADDPGAGGACHSYVVRRADGSGDCLGVVLFQHGPREDDASMSGVTDQDLLEIVRDRLKAFQNGPLPSRETALALTHVEEALLWLARRADDRAERGVLGTMEA